VHIRARQKESEYEESIAAYKETSTFRLVTKWNKKCRVRQKKKALREANRSLRLHYYVRLLTTHLRYPNIYSNVVSTTALCIYQEATSAYAYASSITAVSGSPLWSRGARDGGDEIDELILSWAEGVTKLDSDNLDAVRPFRMQSPFVISVYPFRGLLRRR
jgi:hypothetical protein